MYLRNYLIALASLGLSVLMTPLIRFLPAIAQENQINIPRNSDYAVEKIKIKQLLVEAEKLMQSPDNFFLGLSKYLKGLVFYHLIGEKKGQEIAGQRLEQILLENEPLLSEKRQAMQQSRLEFLKQFSSVAKDNQTARELKKLVTDKFRKDFEKLSDSLSYLDEQIINPTDQLEPLPKKLQSFLDKNQTTITAIRNLILSSEPLQWQFTPDFWDFDQPIPNHWYLVYVQKILLLDSIAQSAKGNQQIVLDNLEVAWRINQSFQNSPLYYTQLLNLMGIKYQMGVLRKLGDLPTIWQERLSNHDYRQSIFIALEGDAYARFNYWTNTTPEKIDLLWETEGIADFLSLAGWDNWSENSRNNILLWFGVGATEYELLAYEALKQANVCQFQSVEFLKEQPINKIEFIYTESLTNLWQKASATMVDAELTQQILQARAIAYAGEELTNNQVTSTICPGHNWVYEQQPGKFTIKMQPEPLEWPQKTLEGQKNHVLPLEFTGSLSKLPQIQQ
jgi:hypothetical protein